MNEPQRMEEAPEHQRRLDCLDSSASRMACAGHSVEDGEDGEDDEAGEADVQGRASGRTGQGLVVVVVVEVAVVGIAAGVVGTAAVVVVEAPAVAVV